MRNNIILTGIPRSGTTLAAALIDGMDDAAALNEPAWQHDWLLKNYKHITPRDFAAWLQEDFTAVRGKLLTGEPVPERRGKQGEAITNYYRAAPDQAKPARAYRLVSFTRPGLTSAFTLAMKHIGPYFAALEAIVATEAFEVVAVIREPVGVIASWNDSPIPLKAGEMPGAALQWPEMAALTGAKMDLLEKQVRVYDLLCEKLHMLKDKIHIIRYEELVASPGLMAAVTGKNPRMAPDTIHARELAFYSDKVHAIRECVEKTGVHYRHFYKTI